MSDDEKLTKVVVDLPNHCLMSGESMWARPLGGDLYEIRNIPFYAYGLNFLDVVRAVASNPERKPEISELVRPGGHRTLRVIFLDKRTEAEQANLLKQLNSLNSSFEVGTPSHFAIDIESEGDYGAVCDQLQAWESDGILEYETCEARNPDSFDANPEEVS